MDELTRCALAARDGDQAALGRFVRLSQADVWRLAAHLVDRDEADDITQEVYERALRSLGNYRGEASARTWLLTIARRTCVDAIRRRARVRVRDGRLRVLAADRADHDLDSFPLLVEEALAVLAPDGVPAAPGASPTTTTSPSTTTTTIPASPTSSIPG